MQTYDPHKKTSDVRQGSDRRMNLRVLTLSCVGIVVGLVLLFGVYSFISAAPV